MKGLIASKLAELRFESVSRDFKALSGLLTTEVEERFMEEAKFQFIFKHDRNFIGWKGNSRAFQARMFI